MEISKMADSNSCVTSHSRTEDNDVRNNVSNDAINTMTNDDNDHIDNEFVASRNQHLQTTSGNSCENETEQFPEASENINTGRCFLYKPFQFLRRRHGLVLASLSPVCFAIQSLFLDILTDTLDAFQVVLMHVPILIICCLVLITYTGVRPSRNHKHYPWLLGSGTFQAGSTCLLALSLTYLAVGDAVTIFYTSLIQVGFFSWLILKEPVRLSDMLSASLAFGGVIFIARPHFIFRGVAEGPSYDVTLLGVIYGLAGSCALAMYNVLNRKLSKLGVDSFFCIFFNVTVVVLISGFVTVILNRWRCPTIHEWLYAFLAGVAYAVAHFSIFYALKVETATLVIVIATTEIVFAFLLQVLFLRIPPFWTSYIGAILILAACIGITLKNKPPMPPSHDPSELMDAEQCRAI